MDSWEPGHGCGRGYMRMLSSLCSHLPHDRWVCVNVGVPAQQPVFLDLPVLGAALQMWSWSREGGLRQIPSGYKQGRYTGSPWASGPPGVSPQRTSVDGQAKEFCGDPASGKEVNNSVLGRVDLGVEVCPPDVSAGGLIDPYTAQTPDRSQGAWVLTWPAKRSLLRTLALGRLAF